MIAFAILGSATRTSLASRGRSMTTDLPMPSGRKRDFAGPTVATPDTDEESSAARICTGDKPHAMASRVENRPAPIEERRIARLFALHFMSGILVVTSVTGLAAKASIAGCWRTGSTVAGLSSEPFTRRGARPPRRRALARTTIRAVYIRFTCYSCAGVRLAHPSLSTSKQQRYKPT